MESGDEIHDCAFFEKHPLAHSSQFVATPSAESDDQIDLFDFFHDKFYRKMPGKMISTSTNSQIFASTDGGDINVFVAAKSQKTRARSCKRS
jgi:hypothetical protein